MRTLEVAPGIRRWSVHDDRIGGEDSEAYAVVDDDGVVVLIDPLPLADSALERLGDLTAIVLTAGNHQRSSWRLRRKLGIPVWAPVDAHGLRAQPDYTYESGDTVPGGFIAIHTPGPTDAMYSLWRVHPRGVVFLSDLLYRTRSGRLRFVPSEYQEAPERTRASVRRLLDNLPMDIVCPSHGRPVVGGGEEAVRRALEEDQEFPPP